MTMTITQGIITATSTDAFLLLQLAAMEVDTKATDISKEQQQQQQQKRPLPTEDALPWNNKRARGASPAATSTTPAPSSGRPTATSHTVTNFLPTSRNSRGHRFLRLHLQLLQALYPNNNNNNNNNNNENESQVPSELWKRIRHYLHTRGRIRALEEQVHDYQKRLNELIDVCDEEEKEDELNRFLAHDPYYGWNNYSARMTMMMPPPPPPQYNMPPPPPSYGGSGRNWMFGTHTSTMTRNSPSSSFSFHERMSSSSSSNLLTGHDHSDGTSAGSMRIHPFGLVAGIWKEEYRLAVQALQKATHPFQPRLLQDVCHRVQGLEELLQGSQTTTGVAPNTSSTHTTAVDTTMDTSNAPSSGTAGGTTAAGGSSIASMDVSGQELPLERPPTPATAEEPGPQTAEKEGSSSTVVAPSGSENSSSDKDAMDATTGASTATATATATNVPLTNAIFQQEVQDQLSGTATTTTTTTTNEVEKAPTIAKDAGNTGWSKGVTFQGVHKQQQQQQQQGESILLENEENGNEDEEERLARHETKLRLWTLLYLDLTTTTTFDNSRS